MARWRKDTGKPIIRRANGKERAATKRDALRLAFFRDAYGVRGFFVMIQRNTGPEVMAVGRTRSDIVGAILLCRLVRFRSWARRIKRRSQGHDAGGYSARDLTRNSLMRMRSRLRKAGAQ